MYLDGAESNRIDIKESIEKIYNHFIITFVRNYSKIGKTDRKNCFI
ncbi:hypothetical protein GCWU000282_01368 [Catonella morbi ATCC 51271]|uniref:Uncharacterized protein n=1 Tax=Catonella morbi ATCC 51271 TaxID=592026 RepID=V2Y326_9FIRM|nr:hypothetical protein GCWU000282_01368 [Catonella morbi ATCC 51271]